jgi:hypothetical protein
MFNYKQAMWAFIGVIVGAILSPVIGHMLQASDATFDRNIKRTESIRTNGDAFVRALETLQHDLESRVDAFAGDADKFLADMATHTYQLFLDFREKVLDREGLDESFINEVDMTTRAIQIYRDDQRGYDKASTRSVVIAKVDPDRWPFLCSPPSPLMAQISIANLVRQLRQEETKLKISEGYQY